MAVARECLKKELNVKENRKVMAIAGSMADDRWFLYTLLLVLRRDIARIGTATVSLPDKDLALKEK